MRPVLVETSRTPRSTRSAEDSSNASNSSATRSSAAGIPQVNRTSSGRPRSHRARSPKAAGHLRVSPRSTVHSSALDCQPASVRFPEPTAAMAGAGPTITTTLGWKTGQLGARLTDRLRGHDADRLADVNPLAGGQRPSVALGADADLRLADQHAERADRVHSSGNQGVDQRLGGIAVHGRDHLAIDLDLLGHTPPGPRVLNVGELAQAALSVGFGDLHR